MSVNYLYYEGDDSVLVTPVYIVNPITGTVDPDRPSQRNGRTHVNKTAVAQTGTTTIHTVTENKILYVTSIALSGFNTNITTSGILNIRDNTTVKLPISIPTAGLAALASFVPLNVTTLTFPEPLQFRTNFNIEENAGTLTFSAAFVGYEE